MRFTKSSRLLLQVTKSRCLFSRFFMVDALIAHHCLAIFTLFYNKNATIGNFTEKKETESCKGQ